VVDRNRLIWNITPSGTNLATSSGSRVTASAVASELSRITPRDRYLLELLHQHGTLTTDQLTACAFGTVGRARNRLNLLRDRGVLDRFRHYHRPGSQSWRWVLAPLGAAIVAASQGEALPRPAAVRDATARLATSPRLDHLLVVNGFFVALAAYARDHDGAELVRWWNEARCREACANLVRPDGHGLWRARGSRVPFWLEVDLGSEQVWRVAGKLAGYAHLGDRRTYPVLFWLPTTQREANLHAHLAHHGVPGGVTIATATMDTTDPDGPAGRVWRTPDHPGRVWLADLPAPAGGTP
jgi:hypothetical protein